MNNKSSPFRSLPGIINAFSVCDCLDNIIKISKENVVFYNDDLVYKQYPLNKLNWINEVFIVNYLNNLPSIKHYHKNIIKFIKCEIVDDYAINTYKNEICLDKKEKVLRIIMKKYDTTLDKIKHFTDDEIFLILHKLISAMLYCISNDILHRDIKERNIFVNYSSVENLRTLDDIVLADFNISSINYYVHSMKKSEINTISHRSPEIYKSIKLSTNIKYGEKTDVWSMCIVLSFLITNHSFYGFLSGSYLQIDPDIMGNVNNMTIVMKHFLKLFANNNLKHIDLYKKIIFMGIQHHQTRSTFQEIFDILRDYNQINGNYNLEFPKIVQIDSPIVINSRVLVKNTKYIRFLHSELQIHDSVLMMFYKSIIKIKTFISIEKLESEVFLFAVYILVLFISDDNHRSLIHYISKFNRIIHEQILFKKSIASIIYKKLSSDQVYYEICKILEIQKFNILH